MEEESEEEDEGEEGYESYDPFQTVLEESQKLKTQAFVKPSPIMNEIVPKKVEAKPANTTVASLRRFNSFSLGPNGKPLELPTKKEIKIKLESPPKKRKGMIGKRKRSISE